MIAGRGVLITPAGEGTNLRVHSGVAVHLQARIDIHATVFLELPNRTGLQVLRLRCITPSTRIPMRGRMTDF